MKKSTIIITSILSVFIVVAVGFFALYRDQIRGLKPAILPPPEDIVKIFEDKENPDNKDKNTEMKETNLVGFPLILPEGFEISIYARDLPGARVMAFDSQGQLWVSQTKENKVSVVRADNNGNLVVSTVFSGLNRPHGLAFDPLDPYLLYIAEEDKISRVRINSDGGLEKLVDLDSGGNHYSRTIAFGPDDRLYISIGSTCNVCNEKNEQRAKIYSMNKDGSDFKEYARGLRNTVFFTWSYVDGRMWGTDMGRDLLGDNLPPDEINIIEEGRNYGWPTCYGKNIHDTEFDKNTYIRNPCMEPFEAESYIDLPAHVAPLGLAFVPEEGWPEEYWYDLLVAYHGSWNSSKPVGYKIARLKLDDKGNYLGSEDFVSGWLTQNNEALGRPVDVITQSGGIMYVSDDKAGVIYKIIYTGLRSEQTDFSFEDCVSSGNPVMESYPRQCRMNGKTYVEDIGNELEKTDLIRVDNPRPNQKITSPLKITGEARGTWFFEASFPVYLYDDNGIELGVGIATAKSDWMTEDFVGFELSLEYEKPTTKKGKLIFQKDNPSDLRELDDMLYMPVVFEY
ncbi:MAG: PQQ-dependent sugar dehydrogenase [bacterium]|nr:PQQ-dependent sugar dehydrogenase [bacterium]